jgi:hypothetical protein
VSTYDAADLLLRFNETALRPTADEITDPTKYRLLTRAQNKVVADIAARVPWVLYGAPDVLATANNKVFTFMSGGFANDSDNWAVTPIGKVKIFPSLSSIPNSPWREGYDYLQEGGQIRIPNDRTYSGTLYWRGIVQPADIDATHSPALLPEASRELIVIEAVRDYASQGERLPSLRDAKASEYGLELARWLLVWRTQFSSGGALGFGGMPGALSTLSGSLAGITVSP